MNINRRSFLKGAAATATGVLGATMLGACSPSTAESENNLSATGTSSDSQQYSFETAPAPITDNIAATEEADVIVVGAGMSGLVTALSSLQNGLSAIVVTASEAPVSRGGSINAPYSSYMEQMGVPRCPVEEYRKEFAMNLSSVDQRKWFKHYNHSEEAMNWLIDIMAKAGYNVGLENTASIKEGSMYYQALGSHGFYDPADGPVGTIGMNMPLVVNVLAQEIEAAGGKIVYKTIGRQLEREDGTDGRVTACIAENEDGSYTRFTGAKAVVLATGDFSKNREMMEKYCNWYVDRMPEEAYTSEVNYDAGFDVNGLYRGEGHQMGLWVGAAWQKNQPNAVMDGTLMAGPHEITYQSCWSLVLNNKGQRFMDEYCGCVAAITNGALQPEGEYWSVWSPQYLDYTRDILLPGYSSYKETPVPSDEEHIARWDESVNDIDYLKADTLEELIDKMGLPKDATLETIENYNKMCLNGTDTEFYKDKEYLIPVSEGPFYAQKNLGPVILTVTGGLRTDENNRVCNESDEPIPGLFNVGTMTGDFYAGYYTFQMCGINYGALCLTLPYLLGSYLADQE